MSAWLAAVPAAEAQSIDPNSLLAARDAVIVELLESLPGNLPDGAIAILPASVPEGAAVDTDIATGWATAVAEALGQLRPEQGRVNRETLEAVLREQRFGDSAYADPDTAVEVGRLVSARMLLLTRIQEFRAARAQVRVVLEMQLIDVETGEDLWSRAYHRGIFPMWARVFIGIAAVAAVLGVIAVRKRRRRVLLVSQELPEAQAGARVDLDGLTEAVDRAREQLHTAGHAEAAAEVQAARVRLDSALDLVRHALPSGAVDKSRARDLKAARREVEKLAAVIEQLGRSCDALEVSDTGGKELVRELTSGAVAVRNGVTEYKRHLN